MRRSCKKSRTCKEVSKNIIYNYGQIYIHTHINTEKIDRNFLSIKPELYGPMRMDNILKTTNLAIKLLTQMNSSQNLCNKSFA